MSEKVSREAMEHHVADSNQPVSGIPTVVEQGAVTETVDRSNLDVLRDAEPNKNAQT